MEPQKDYDVIVIGLGTIGLSTTYYLSKQDFNVLGLEMNKKSGSLGTGCSGNTSTWRYIDTDVRYT